MKNFRFFLTFFLSKYFPISVILQIPIIASEKLHENLSNYNQFLLKKKKFEVKKRYFLVKKLEIKVIVFMIMLTHSSERIFNTMRYTGCIYLKLIHDRYA